MPYGENGEASIFADQPFEIDFVSNYPDIPLYMNYNGGLLVWEGDGWEAESLSWKQSCYVHAGLSSAEATISGPDAQKVVSMASINDCYNWPVGKAKHLVMCDENGLIMAHGLTNRTAEDEFVLSAANPWPWMRLIEAGGYDAKMSFRDVGIFQVAGPNSLTCLEDLTQTDLHDVKCLEFQPVTIPGLETGDILFQRVGMAGTLSYELRCGGGDAEAVFGALLELGREKYDMKVLGWRTYYVNHTEAGYGQVSFSFEQSMNYDEEYLEANPDHEVLLVGGSFDPENHRARMRTPGELGWSWMAKFDHDFVGREAVEAESREPKRGICTLEWNDEDVVDIYASQFTDDPYRYMEMPITPQGASGAWADRVLDADGNVIGVSSCPVYSKYFHKMITQCTIDADQNQIGNEVIVEWGDYGGKIKRVRAKVERYPYLDLVRNEVYDMATVPYGCPESEIGTR